MIDEEEVKAFFAYTNRGWPKPTLWENLSEGAKYLWRQRLEKEQRRENLLHK